MSPIVDPAQARLAAYLVLAAGVAPGGASAQVVSRTNLNLVVAPVGDIDRATATLSLGPGFGNVFEFEAYRKSSVRHLSFSTSSGDFVKGPEYNYFKQSARFRLNAVNGSTVMSLAARPVPYTLDQNIRLGASVQLDTDLNLDWRRVNRASLANHTQRYHSHHLVGDFVTTHQYPFERVRGFIGFRISKAGSGSYNFGWLDIEYDRTQGANALTIHGFGLNLTPHGSIYTGELGAPMIPAPGPGALALLAAGAGGIRRTRGRAA